MVFDKGVCSNLSIPPIIMFSEDQHKWFLNFEEPLDRRLLLLSLKNELKSFNSFVRIWSSKFELPPLGFSVFSEKLITS